VEVLSVQLQRGHVAPTAQLREGGTRWSGVGVGQEPAAFPHQHPHPRAGRQHVRQCPPSARFTSRVLIRGTGVTGSRVQARLVLKENSTDSVPMMVQQELSLSSALFASFRQGEA
jgi:hypothetical protein